MRKSGLQGVGDWAHQPSFSGVDDWSCPPSTYRYQSRPRGGILPVSFRASRLLSFHSGEHHAEAEVPVGLRRGCRISIGYF
jgi:hypothetical protein